MHFRIVPEEVVYVDLPGTERLKIKGLLRGSYDQPLVVMMHGRGGQGNSLLEYRGARYLYEQGFASLRLFMYAGEHGTRNIGDCTLDTHVANFDIVIEYLRSKGVQKLLATGHSYGGQTILISQAKLDGAVLWDPSHGSYWAEHPEPEAEFPEVILGDYVIGTSGKGYIFPKKMDEYDRKSGDTTELAAHKGYPLEIISAGAGGLSHLGKRYIEAADEPKKHVVIEGAHHQFEDSDEVILQLFKETADWFKEILHG